MFELRIAALAVPLRYVRFPEKVRQSVVSGFGRLFHIGVTDPEVTSRTKKTFREIYGKVARCANEFQIVGNMLSQAEPVYAALPWVSLL